MNTGYGTHNIATNTGDIATNAANILGLNSDLSRAFDEIDENREGVAMAIALESPVLVGAESVGFKANFGAFEGETAFGLSAVGVLHRNVIGSGERLNIDAGVGFGFDHGTVGGRAGLQLTW